MTARPIETHGTLHSINGRWHVAITDADPSFEDSMPVRLVLWDARGIDARSEVERIALTQQLEVGIVALGLSAEGALAA